jgi:zinc protease
VVGDVERNRVRSLVGKYWGEWKRGEYKTEVPSETEQKSPRAAHVDWPSPTLPLLTVMFRAPAYSDTDKDFAALNLLNALAFSESSDLYQKLVIQQQKVDMLSGFNSAHVDPYAFEIIARIKKSADVETVRDDIYATLTAFKQDLIPAEKLDRVRKRMRYGFALGLNNSEAIASTLARFIALRRTPETINRLFSLYEELTPEDIRNAARKYFVDSGRTVVTLSEAKSR